MKRNQMLRLIANTIYNNTFRTSTLETLPLAEKIIQELEQVKAIPVNVNWKYIEAPWIKKIPGQDTGYTIAYDWELDDGVIDPVDSTVWEDTRGNK